MRGRDRGSCGSIYTMFSTCACSARGELIAPWRTVAEELVELWRSRPHTCIRSTFGVLGTGNQRQPLENVPEYPFLGEQFSGMIDGGRKSRSAKRTGKIIRENAH
jgi:hypothetical protein